MAKKQQKLSTRGLIKAIEEVGGVSKTNAINIFNLFANGWKELPLSFLTVLDGGQVVTARTTRRPAIKNTTKAKVTTKTTETTTTKKATKKVKNQVVVGKVKTKGKKKKLKLKNKNKNVVIPGNNRSNSSVTA